MIITEKTVGVWMMKTLKLAPCPDCKRRISLAATTCPKCGRTIMPGDLQPIPIQTKPPSVALPIIIGILLFFLLLVAYQKGKELNDARDRQIQRMEQTGRDMYR
jgi:hypothetical protein